MKRIQSNLETYDIDKISLDDEIHTLAYFHKYSFRSCKEIKKDCQEIKKIMIKKIVIIEKDCD